MSGRRFYTPQRADTNSLLQARANPQFHRTFLHLRKIFSMVLPLASSSMSLSR